MSTDKIQTGLRLNKPTYDKVKALSKKEKRSLNNVMEYIVEDYIATYEEKNGSLTISESTD